MRRLNVTRRQVQRSRVQRRRCCHMRQVVLRTNEPHVVQKHSNHEGGTRRRSSFLQTRDEAAAALQQAVVRDLPAAGKPWDCSVGPENMDAGPDEVEATSVSKGGVFVCKEAHEFQVAATCDSCDPTALPVVSPADQSPRKGQQLPPEQVSQLLNPWPMCCKTGARQLKFALICT